MSELEYPIMPEISESETFGSKKNAKIIIPKKTVFNYKFTCWIPMNPKDYPEDVYPYPILPESNKLLIAFKILMLSKKCPRCKKTLFPKPSKNFQLSECKTCKATKIPQIKNQQSQSQPGFKRSSTLLRLSSLLDSLFMKYHINAEFQEKSDYTERFYQELNKQIYVDWTINKDASEVKSCIDALISWDKWHQKYFTIDGKTHTQLLDEVLKSDDIFKFQPFYKLLIMASSVIKAVVPQIKPQIRGSRMSPANVTNMSNPNMAQPKRVGEV